MNDEEVWDKAIRNAKKAFNKTFEKAGYDAAYWTIEIISHSMNSDFKSIMKTKISNNLGEYELQRSNGCIKRLDE